MKKLLLLVFPLMSLAQFQADENGHLMYQKVFDVDSTSKEDIKEYALQWAAQRFENTNYNVNYESTEKVIINSLSTLDAGGTYYAATDIDYDIIFDIKENKYRLTLDEVYYVYEVGYNSFVNAQFISKGFENTKVKYFDKPLKPSDYQKMMIDQWKDQPNGRAKRLALKRLRDRDKLMKDYMKFKEANEKLTSSMKNILRNIPIDVYNYIQKNADTTDDW